MSAGMMIALGIAIALIGVVVSARFQGRIGALARPVSLAVGALLLILGAFNGIFFYAEPGFKYHVRTILGEEKMVSDTGYNTYLFGRYNAWKNAMSVQASADGGGRVQAEIDSDTTSADLRPQTLVFLDQVDAQVTATTRFQLPDAEEDFLRLARQFRTPANLLRTELIPAFQETLAATASLITAENYFSGGRNEFNTEFQNQMQNGIYNVRRKEETRNVRRRTGTANASLGTEQEEFGDDQQVVFVVEKILDATGQPVRKPQNFNKFGINVVSARVTNVQPNERFRSRMEQKQDAAAARSVAREQRVQEEEQRLLAITRGEREVAERQAAAKVEQIQLTTEAETRKQLAVTAANQRAEEAAIDRDTARIRLEQAKIDAESRQVSADAAAYEKRAIIEADNALQQKLDAYVKAQGFWADAFAKRAVPQTVFGGAGGGVGGTDNDVQDFLNIMTMRAARDLSVDPGIAAPVRAGQ